MSGDDARIAERRARYARYLSLDTLFPVGPFEPHWCGDEALWFLVDDGGEPALRYVDLASGDGVVTIPLSTIEAALPRAPQRLTVDRVEAGDGRLWLTIGADVIAVDPATRSVASVSTVAGVARPGTFLRELVLANPAPVPDVVSRAGTRFATVVDGDVHVVTIADGASIRLTDDAAPEIRWDLESGRRAFQRVKAFVLDPWSPDDRLLFAMRVDRRGVHAVPLIDFLGEEIVVGAFTVETPGAPLARVDCFLLDADGGERIAIDLGDTRERMIVPIGWMPDGSGFWLARCTRDLTRVEVIEVDRRGTPRVVLVEASDTFVRIQHNLLYPGDAGCLLLPDSSGFLWLSERSGWNHLHAVDRRDGAIRALTAGPWPVLAIEGVDAACTHVFVTAHSDLARPYDVHLLRVPLDGGAPIALTKGPGQRAIDLSPSRRSFVQTRSTPGEPPVTTAHDARVGGNDADGRVLRTTDIAALEAIGWRPPEEVVVKSLDGTTDLWGILYLPADFDPGRSYPVLEHIYAGPQVAYADRGFSLGHAYKPWNVPQAIAQLGYAVVVIDTEGTPERSKPFHDGIHKAMGSSQVHAHAAAIRAIAATRPYLDLDRVGVFGHSWGGFYALRALVDAPDLYRAAVVSGPGLTPMTVMSEPYLGSDRNHPAYADYDCIGLAPRIRGQLLMVAGTAEVSLFHDAMRMTHALIDAGVRHEFIVLPGQPHGYSGRSADYFIEATRRFFERTLGTDLLAPAPDEDAA